MKGKIIVNGKIELIFEEATSNEISEVIKNIDSSNKNSHTKQELEKNSSLPTKTDVYPSFENFKTILSDNREWLKLGFNEVITSLDLPLPKGNQWHAVYARYKRAREIVGFVPTMRLRNVKLD